MTKHTRSADDIISQALDLAQRGEEVAASRLLREALTLEPRNHGAMGLLGMVLLERDTHAAIEMLEEALGFAPDVAWYYLVLGNGYSKIGKDAHAVAAMQKSALLGPESEMPHYDLARHYLRRQQPTEALAALRRVLAIRTEHPQARFLVASLTGGQADTAPASYVAELFDSYAPTFETHLVGELQYDAPDQLAAMVEADGTDGPRAWNVVDLGCGSGLAGVAFRGLAKHMVGSDLSPRMIERANLRGVYDEVAVEDLLDTLGRAHDVDLVVAADVFVYVGALDEVFAAAAKALRPGGRFAFSTERDDRDGDGVVLRPTSRYAHADRYIRALATRHGFEIRAANDVTLRVDHGAAIPGTLFLLARTA